MVKWWFTRHSLQSPAEQSVVKPAQHTFCDSEVGRKYRYLKTECTYVQAYAQYLDQNKNKMRTFKKTKSVVVDGYTVHVDYAFIDFDSAEQVSVFVGLYPKDSDWLHGEDLPQRDAAFTEPGRPRPRNSLSQKWHRIVDRHLVRESVCWVTLRDIRGELEIWELPRPLKVIEAAVKLLKGLDRVNLNQFFLVGDGPGGEFAMRRAGPALRHHFAGVGVTNCPDLSSELRPYYVDFPLVIATATRAFDYRSETPDKPTRGSLFDELEGEEEDKDQEASLTETDTLNEIDASPTQNGNDATIIANIYASELPTARLTQNQADTRSEQFREKYKAYSNLYLHFSVSRWLYAQIERNGKFGRMNEEQRLNSISSFWRIHGKGYVIKDRVPCPVALEWNQPEGPKNLTHYWLALTSTAVPGTVRIVARRLSSTAVKVDAQGVTKVVVRCQEPFFDLSQPITFTFNGKTIVKKLKREKKAVKEATEQMGDPCLVYSAQVTLR